jgi:hypothetical protein
MIAQGRKNHTVDSWRAFIVSQAVESSGIPGFSTSWQTQRVVIALFLSEIIIN